MNELGSPAAPGTDRPAVPTEKEFRDAGMTADAINYPLSEAAFARLVAFNNVPDGYPIPRAWRYAPNEHVRDYWEERAQ